MIRKVLKDWKVANDSGRKRLDDLRELLAKMRNKRDDSGKMNAKYCRLEDDYDKNWAIQEATARSCAEQMQMLQKEQEFYRTALR